MTAIGSAVAWGSINVLSKHLLKDIDSLEFTAIFSILGLTLYTPIFLFFALTTEIGFSLTAVGAGVISGIANIGGWWIYNHAIKSDEISVVAPFSKFVTVFTALLGFLVLGEKISPMKGLGILLVTLGSYIILTDQEENWMRPFSHLINRKGPKLALITAVLGSIGALADRVATQRISPVIFTFFIYGFMATGFSAIIFSSNSRKLGSLKPDFFKKPKIFIMIGLAAALGSFLTFYSFSKAEASSVVPLLQ